MKQLDLVKVGNFIAKLRKENGLTQEELANKLMISDKAVSKWEGGKIYQILNVRDKFVNFLIFL